MNPRLPAPPILQFLAEMEARLSRFEAQVRRPAHAPPSKAWARRRSR